MATPKAKSKVKATAKAKTAPKSKATAKSGATAQAKTTPKSKATAKAKAAVATTGGRVRVTQVRSSIGRLATHKACLGGLGLRRMHHTVEVADTPENRGMINRISYMVSVEEV